MALPPWTPPCPDPGATRRLGEALGRTRPEGLVVALVGPLGAGKTALAQGVGAGLHVDGEVTSPTFVILSEHEGPVPLLHADLYRLEEDELDAIGLEELLETWPGLALVEWADRFPPVLPLDHLEVRLALGEGQERRVEVRAHGPRSQAALAAWQDAWEAG